MLRGNKEKTKTHVLKEPDIDPVQAILEENDRRNKANRAKFNPITGEGSIGKRVKIEISDFPLPIQYVPEKMMKVPLVNQLVEAVSIEKFVNGIGGEGTEEEYDKVKDQFIRIRIKHDFAFWAALYIFVLSKIPGQGEIRFRLNRAQRRLVAKLEEMRLANKPIRIILLKSRQWGGSTCIQLYMAWLQLVHKTGLNSVIVSQKKKTSFAIKAMYDRALEHYPIEMLYRLGEEYNENEKKMENVGLSGDYKRVPQRDCTITIASYEAPDAIRGDAYALAHFSEVGLWEATEKKTAEKVVRSASQGIAYRPYTMIAYESTANGTGNFFHKEYLAAKKKKSQFESIFVSWMEVDWDTLDFASLADKMKFAKWLYDNRNSETVESNREEPGTYLWRLWQMGATLEGINWYVAERSKCECHADMAAECPSDDDEAFTFSGRKVFAHEDIETFRSACKPPKFVGEIYGRADEGEEALENVRFRREVNGRFKVWRDVENDDDEEVTDRYLVVVDVCKGHTERADFADIYVLDRFYMIDGEPPETAAEWHGHIDMDKLAWMAAQTATYYNNALLVIESNTLETNNTKGDAEYILTLVREVYSNLYARKQSAEDIREGAPRKYGWHTNKLTKPPIIHNLKTCVREHLYIEREEECLDEYETYIETENGGFEAMEGHHDDRVMVRAIGLHICYHEMEFPTIVKKEKRTGARVRKVVSAATL